MPFGGKTKRVRQSPRPLKAWKYNMSLKVFIIWPQVSKFILNLTPNRMNKFTLGGISQIISICILVKFFLFGLGVNHNMFSMNVWQHAKYSYRVWQWFAYNSVIRIHRIEKCKSILSDGWIWTPTLQNMVVTSQSSAPIHVCSAVAPWAQGWLLNTQHRFIEAPRGIKPSVEINRPRHVEINRVHQRP